MIYIFIIETFYIELYMLYHSLFESETTLNNKLQFYGNSSFIKKNLVMQSYCKKKR